MSHGHTRIFRTWTETAGGDSEREREERRGEEREREREKRRKGRGGSMHQPATRTHSHRSSSSSTMANSICGSGAAAVVQIRTHTEHTAPKLSFAHWPPFLPLPSSFARDCKTTTTTTRFPNGILELNKRTRNCEQN